MTNNDFMQILANIANALNTIDVKGTNNVRTMADIFNYIDKIGQTINKYEQKKNKQNEQKEAE